MSGTEGAKDHTNGAKMRKDEWHQGVPRSGLDGMKTGGTKARCGCRGPGMNTRQY